MTTEEATGSSSLARNDEKVNTISRLRIGLLTVGTLIVLVGVAAFLLRGTGVVYENPVFEPILADPSIVRADDGWFYAYGTEDDWGDGEGSRLIPIVRSRDLVEWEYVGEAFSSRPDWKAGYLWAPDIARFRGRYYLYYSVSVWGDANPAIGVAVADEPGGPFDDHGQLFDSEGIGVDNSIDPQLFVEDGIPYLIWGSFHGIYAVELAENGLEVVGDPVLLAGGDFEAPYIIERGGEYWFFGSLGSCCDGANSTYRVAVGRADDLLGPYSDAEDRDLRAGPGTLILREGDRFVGPGHNAVVTDDQGEDWIVYHAIEREHPRADSGATRRPMLIDPLVWEDGWPAVEAGVPGEGPQRAPLIDGP